MTMRFVIPLQLRVVGCGLVLALALPSVRGQIAIWSGTGEDWATAAKWSLGSVPGASDTAQISTGTVTVSDARSIGSLLFSGGTLTGTGTLTITGASSSWTGGTMSGAGLTQVSAGGTLTIATGNPTLNGRSLTNAGTINHNPPNYLILSGTGTLTNASGGLWDLKNNTAFSNGGTWSFDNQAGATLRKSTTTGTVSFSVPLTNAGTVDVAGGIFSIDAGGSATGAFALAAGSTLKFNSNYSLNAGSSFSSTGTLHLANGTLTLARGSAFATSTNFSFTGGTLTGADDFNTPSGVTTTWTGGTMSGTGTTKVLSGGTLAINTGNPTLNGRSLHNAGTINHSPPNYLILSGTGTLTNASGGLWDLQNNTTFSNGGTWSFDNQAGATLRKSTTTGTVSFSVPLTNAGTVDVAGGIFSIDAGGSATGAFALAAGSTLKFNSNYSLNAGSSVSSTGTLHLANGTLTLARGSAFATSTNFSFTGGTLTGADDFNTPSGVTTTWTGGTMAGTGATKVLAGGTLAINTGNPTLNGRSLHNAGTVNHSPPNYLILSGTGTLTNASGGLWDLQNNTTFSNGGTWSFDNQAGATLRKSTTTGTVSFSVPLTNAGTVDVAGGIFSIDAGGSATGAFALAAGSTLKFNSNYSLNAGSSFSSTGTLHLANGTLTLARGSAFATSTNFSFTGGTLTGADDFNTPSGVTTTWTGGTMAGTGTTKVLAGGTLAINTGNPTLNGRSLHNAGTINHSPPNYLILSGTGTLTNASGGVWDLQNNTAFSNGGTWSFDNQAGATLRKSTTTGTASFGIPLTNAGTVDVAGGIFSIDAGGSATGAFALAAGSTLKFNSNYSLNAGSSFSSTGNIHLANGTLTLARGSAFATSTNFSFTGGTLTGADDFNTPSGVTTTWTGGTMSGTGTTKVLAGGTLAINTGNPTLNGRSLHNAGTINHSPPNYLILSGTGTLTNASGGIWDFQNNAAFSNGGTWSFLNEVGAILRKTTLSGSLSFGVPLTNSGAIEVTGGTLSLDAGGSSSGAITTSAGAVTAFGNNFSIDGGSLGGPGTYRLNSGTLSINTGLTVSNLAVTGGTLGGSGALQTNTLNWTGGTMGGTGATTVAAGGALTINGYVNLDRTLTNNSTAGSAWIGAGYIYSSNSGGVINNAGLLDIQGDSTIYYATFNNSGTLTKSAGTATTNFNNYGGSFNNTGTVNVNTGTIALQNGGTSTGAFNIASGATLAFGGGTHALNSGSSVAGAGTLAVTGGTTTVAGTFGANTRIAVSGGTANFNPGSGAMTPASIAISNGTAVFSVAATTPTLTLSGGELEGSTAVDTTTFNWTGGTLGGTGTTTVAAGGVLTINGYVNLDRTLINNSTAGSVWSGPGYIYSTNSGGLINNVGLLDIQGDSTVYHATVNNSGTLTKSSGTGTTSFNSYSGAFNNTGTVNVNSGTLALQNGGTSTGTFNIASGATLRFGGGTHALNAGSSVVGDGTVAFTGGTTNLAGNYGLTTGIAISGGVANFNPSSGAITPASITISSGTGNFSTAATTSALVMSGGTLDGNSAVNTTTFNWTGGTLGGTGTTTVAAGGTLTINGYVNLDRTLINNSTAGSVWSGPGYIYSTNSGGVFNNVGALDIQGDSTVYHATFNNSGTLTKSTGTGVTTFNAYSGAFNNTGSVTVNSGTLSLQNGGTDTGAFSIASGATLLFSGGTHLLNAGSSVSGAGTMAVSGGTTTLAGTYGAATRIAVSGGTANFNPSSGAMTPASITISSGTASFSVAATTPSLVMSGGVLNGITAVDTTALSWTGGTLGGTGTTTVAAGGSLTINGYVNLDRTLTNHSTTGVWSGPGYIYSSNSGGVFNNVGTLDIQGDSTVYHATVNNSGTVTKSAGTGVTTFNAYSGTFHNTGTVRAQTGTLAFAGGFTNTGGTLVAAGGNFNFSSAVNLGTGTLRGTGTVTAPTVTTGGVISPGNSAGALAIAGNLSLLSTSQLLIELGGTTQGADYDLLSVTGTGALGGTLAVSFLNGFQTFIAPTATFTVMTATNGFSGAFLNASSGTRLFTSDGAGSFLVSYGSGSPFGATNLVLSEFVAVPEPSTWALLGLGSVVVVISIRRRSQNRRR